MKIELKFLLEKYKTKVAHNSFKGYNVVRMTCYIVHTWKEKKVERQSCESFCKYLRRGMKIISLVLYLDVSECFVLFLRKLKTFYKNWQKIHCKEILQTLVSFKSGWFYCEERLYLDCYRQHTHVVNTCINANIYSLHRYILNHLSKN